MFLNYNGRVVLNPLYTLTLFLQNLCASLNSLFYQLGNQSHQSLKKKKGGKHILVPTFSGYSHFSHYILFLPLLVPILKNASRFGPCRYIKNGES